MKQESPVWLRPDGTDERLENPIAYLVWNFHHYPKDKHLPYHNKAKVIERKYPEFAQSLLSISDEINNLDVLSRIFSENKPTGAEIARHGELIRNRLQQVEQFIVGTYGSVEAFMDWWEK